MARQVYLKEQLGVKNLNKGLSMNFELSAQTTDDEDNAAASSSKMHSRVTKRQKLRK